MEQQAVHRPMSRQPTPGPPQPRPPQSRSRSTVAVIDVDGDDNDDVGSRELTEPEKPYGVEQQAKRAVERTAEAKRNKTAKANASPFFVSRASSKTTPRVGGSSPVRDPPSSSGRVNGQQQRLSFGNAQAGPSSHRRSDHQTMSSPTRHNDWDAGAQSMSPEDLSIEHHAKKHQKHRRGVSRATRPYVTEDDIPHAGNSHGEGSGSRKRKSSDGELGPIDMTNSRGTIGMTHPSGGIDMTNSPSGDEDSFETALQLPSEPRPSVKRSAASGMSAARNGSNHARKSTSPVKQQTTILSDTDDEEVPEPIEHRHEPEAVEPIERQESVDEIQQFSPTPPIQSKPEPKATAKPVLPPTPAQLSKKKRMQGRDGAVPVPQRVELKPSTKRPPPSRTDPIPSSRVGNNVVADVEFCFVTDHESCINYKVRAAFCSVVSVSGDSYLDLAQLVGQETKTARIPLAEVLTAELSRDGESKIFFRLHIEDLPLQHINELKKITVTGHTTIGNAVVIYLLLRPSSQKSEQVLHRLHRALKENHCRVTSLDENAIESFRSIYEDKQNFVEPSRGLRSSGQRSKAAADAAERRLRQQSGAIGDDNFYGTAVPRKDKGRSKPRENDDAYQSKLDFQKASAKPAPPRRSNRINDGPRRLDGVPVSDPDTDEGVIAVDRPRPPRKSPRLDKHELLFPYPLEGPTAVTLTKGERYRLADKDFLNDVFLEFGLRYTIDNVAPELQPQLHLFNSFFYDRLGKKDKKAKTPGDVWPAYDMVKKWTKNANIFDKKFLILPINESFHWFLAVIYNPGGILRSSTGVTQLAGEPSAAPVTRSAAAAIVDDAGSTVDGADSGKGSPASGLDAHVCPSSPPPLMPGRYGDPPSERDPIDCMSESEMDQDTVLSGEHSTSRLSRRVKSLSISPKGKAPRRKSPTPSPPLPPQPIHSWTFEVFQQQGSQQANHHEPSPSPSPPPPLLPPPPVPEVVDHKVPESDEAWIMTFDSLGAPHKAVGNTLKRWLHFEARDKLKIDYEPMEANYIDVKVPLQPNFSDCGVFLIHYVHMLLHHPDAILSFAGKAPPGKASSPEREAWTAERDKVWEQGKTGELRTDWEEVMNTLTAQYQSLHPTEPKDSVPELPGSQASVMLSSQAPENATKTTTPALPTVKEQPTTHVLDPMPQQLGEQHPNSSTMPQPFVMAGTSPPARERESSPDGLMDPAMMDQGPLAHPTLFTFADIRNSRSPPASDVNSDVNSDVKSDVKSDVNMDSSIAIHMPSEIDRQRAAAQATERPSTLSPTRAPVSGASASSAGARPTPSPFSDLGNMSSGDFANRVRKHQNLVPTNNLASPSREIGFAQPARRDFTTSANPTSSHSSKHSTPPLASSPAKRQDVQRVFRQQLNDVQITTAAPPPVDHVPDFLDAMSGEEEEPAHVPRRSSTIKSRMTLYNDLDDADDEGTPAAGSPTGPLTRTRSRYTARKSTDNHAPSGTRLRTTLPAQAAGRPRANSASAASSRAGSTGAGPGEERVGTMTGPMSGTVKNGKRPAVKQYGRNGAAGAAGTAGDKRLKVNEDEAGGDGKTWDTAIGINSSSDEED